MYKLKSSEPWKTLQSKWERYNNNNKKLKAHRYKTGVKINLLWKLIFCDCNPLVQQRGHCWVNMVDKVRGVLV